MPGENRKPVCWERKRGKCGNVAGRGQGRVGPGLEQGWVSYHFGLEGWLHLPLLQQDPVDSLEKGMKSDVSCHSQPLDWLPLEQLQSTGASVRTQGHEKLELLQTLADQGLQGQTGSAQEHWG